MNFVSEDTPEARAEEPAMKRLLSSPYILANKLKQGSKARSSQMISVQRSDPARAIPEPYFCLYLLDEVMYGLAEHTGRR
jgi:hypothetical protein